MPEHMPATVRPGMPPYGYLRSRGMTLVELVASIVILAIALIGIIIVMRGGIERSADTLIQTRAAALSQSYLNEIFGKRFDENSAVNGIPPCRMNCTTTANFGPDAGETGRSDYDDVDDYHGLDEGSGQATPLQDSQGNTRQGYDNFRVQVSVRYIDTGAGGTEATLGATADDLDENRDGKLVTLTVTHDAQSTGWNFSVYKANF